MTTLRGKRLAELASPETEQSKRAVEKMYLSVIEIQNEISTLDDVYKGSNILTYFNKGNEQERAKNKLEMEKLIAFLILSYANSLNISPDRKPSTSQIVEITTFLIKDAMYERVEDIILAFKWAKQGRYGEIYGRMDVPTVLNIWVRYKAEKDANFYESKKKEIEKYKESRVKANYSSSSDHLKDQIREASFRKLRDNDRI